MALVVANGSIKNPVAILDKIKKDCGFDKIDLIISADGGADNTLQMGLIPDVVIGDMDSIKITDKEKIREKSARTRFISTSMEKDETDTQLALGYALDMEASRIIIAGALGDRIDHSLANIMLLAWPRLEGKDVRIITDCNEIFVTRKPVSINGEPDKILTLMSLSPYTYFNKTTGLKYGLEEEKLFFSPVRGLSNIFTCNKAFIDIREGILLVIREL